MFFVVTTLAALAAARLGWHAAGWLASQILGSVWGS